MKIQLKLFANVKQYHPNDDQNIPVEYSDGSTVGEIIDALGIPEKLAKIVFVNGIQAGPEVTLKEGDRLAVFPPLAGG